MRLGSSLPFPVRSGARAPRAEHDLEVRAVGHAIAVQIRRTVDARASRVEHDRDVRTADHTIAIQVGRTGNRGNSRTRELETDFSDRKAVLEATLKESTAAGNASLRPTLDRGDLRIGRWNT